MTIVLEGLTVKVTSCWKDAPAKSYVQRLRDFQKELVVSSSWVLVTISQERAFCRLVPVPFHSTGVYILSTQ